MELNIFHRNKKTANNPLITVVGSSNMDLVVKTSRFPTKGETISGGDFFMNPGGKGANQAVAASMMGAEVCFISRIGKDIFGNKILADLEGKGIRTDCLISDEEFASGIALIMVDKKGENIIAVAPGVNSNLCPGDIDRCKSFVLSSKLLLLQLEIPLTTVRYAIDLAYENKIPVILNPAPAARLDNDLLGKIDIVIPNQKEAQLLTGIEVKDFASAEKAGKIFLNKGINKVVLTMGEKGALLITENGTELFPGNKVKAVDTTAAGDVFVGSSACCLAEGKDLASSVKFANSAAALSVTKTGAQSSIPTRNEVENFLKKE